MKSKWEFFECSKLACKETYINGPTWRAIESPKKKKKKTF
jgi:hypothetical protein